MKDKKGKRVQNPFIEVVNESNCKPNKLWVDQGRELFNKRLYFNNNLKNNNDILMYSAHNEGKSVIAWKIYKNIKS